MEVRWEDDITWSLPKKSVLYIWCVARKISRPKEKYLSMKYSITDKFNNTYSRLSIFNIDFRKLLIAMPLGTTFSFYISADAPEAVLPDKLVNLKIETLGLFEDNVVLANIDMRNLKLKSFDLQKELTLDYINDENILKENQKKDYRNFVTWSITFKGIVSIKEKRKRIYEYSNKKVDSELLISITAENGNITEQGLGLYVYHQNKDGFVSTSYRDYTGFNPYGNIVNSTSSTAIAGGETMDFLYAYPLFENDNRIPFAFWFFQEIYKGKMTYSSTKQVITPNYFHLQIQLG